MSAAAGFERYYYGRKVVLESESFEDANKKIKNLIDSRGGTGQRRRFYYSEGGSLLWSEYQFLFLCQLIEFKTAEAISVLAKVQLVSPELVEHLKQGKRANPERSKSPQRLVSPASLLGDFQFNLGKLAKIIDSDVRPFQGKKRLLSRLKAFNRERNTFIHRSFNNSPKSPSECITHGLFIGKRLLQLIDTMAEGLLVPALAQKRAQLRRVARP
jgi:hypothetical protein